mgnify:CR=1 FL=1
MGRPIIDITGQVFDTLTVIKKTNNYSKSGQILWELLCKCGEICYATSSDLKRNRRNFCKKCRDQVADLSPYKSLYGNYKRHANRRGYTFELGIDQFINIVQSNCNYCGEEPNQWYKKEGSRKGIFYNGIDRQDNTLGYTLENAKPCCKFCNLAKKTFPAEELVAWLNRVALRKNK